MSHRAGLDMARNGEKSGLSINMRLLSIISEDRETVAPRRFNSKNDPTSSK